MTQSLSQDVPEHIRMITYPCTHIIIEEAETQTTVNCTLLDDVYVLTSCTCTINDMYIHVHVPSNLELFGSRFGGTRLVLVSVGVRRSKGSRLRHSTAFRSQTGQYIYIYNCRYTLNSAPWFTDMVSPSPGGPWQPRIRSGRRARTALE